ncbi:SpvB/TcaC N-terminal domain-containing protein [Mariniphaga sp.]|uniref:SpvB/TcaC N-terminal domain-containing protein n=1 Tax=Mariniphaga sp. TaxID=1954475 RepID=UPI0035648CD6
MNKETENQNTSSQFLKTDGVKTESNAIQIPQISLPKGGGAFKGIDEKFEVNAANGTAGFSIPLPITPGRNNFSPPLSLSYNSGGGNGIFGLGWSVALPVIQRKTDKRLPRYRDGLEEDIFMFSGAEDLVPFLEKDDSGWKDKNYPNNGVDGYTIKRYRPRIEGGFTRIEKIHHEDHGFYWKVTTRENIATIFGRGPNARIANPEDKTQIFQWMPEFSYDDKGNWIKYQYKKDTNINDDGSLNNDDSISNTIYEKNRKNGIAPYTNTYLKSVKYGNRIAYYADFNKPYDPQTPDDKGHFFELVLDYGEHGIDNPKPDDAGQWNYRADAFSSYRSGFEIRTNRLCKRILMFHHFKDEKQFVGTPEEGTFGENYLVRSLDLEYKPSSINDSGQSETTYLLSITQSGYIRKLDGTYSKKSLPPMEFSYEKLNWNKTIKKVSPENIINAPVGLTNNYQWVDLHGEGISGILSEQGDGWFYKSNFGDVNEDGNVAFTVAKQVIPKPSFTGLSGGLLSIQDLAANGEKQVVVNSEDIKGYFELTHDNNWKPFMPFEQIVNVDLQDPNTRLLDLNGDGQPDIVITEENVFTWYAADGKKGHQPAEIAHKTFDEETGPAIVFADQLQTIFLADMSGDGLTDIVRIRNGEICYWANKGYGEFSAKITMGNSPVFDNPDIYNPQFLHLADVSGTGATDIIYLGRNSFKSYINLSGNAWSDAHEIEPFFLIDDHSKLSVTDLLGTGTSCIVWSSDLPAYANAPMQYIDLMDSKKPHVLVHYKNNFGNETTIQYKSSTHYYLKDKKKGKPWITKLPFPVQVVSKLVVEEKITDVHFSSKYQYHHGYYDHPEREFRGFGMVEQTDSEHYAEWVRNNATNQLEKAEELFQKPVLTKTWFHTGAFLDKERILTQFKDEYWYKEYYKQFPDSPHTIEESELPDAHLSNDIKALLGDEYREALRACKGIMLRQEIFALDAPKDSTDAELQLQMKPYSVATHNCNIQLQQPKDKNEFGVFIVTESEAITISYERDVTDSRIAHTLNTKIDELGNILESASVVYGRNQAKADVDFQNLSDNITDFSEDVLNNDSAQKTQLSNAFNANIQAAKDEQTKTHIIYTQNSFAKYNDGISDFDDIDLPHAYRYRLPHETKTYELTGFTPSSDIFNLSELENALPQATEIGYHESPGGGKKIRLIEHIKSNYLDDNLNELPFGFFDTLGLPFQNYQLAYTIDLVKDIYKKDGTELQVDGDDVSNFIQAKGKYSVIGGKLWIRSGIIHFKANAGEAVANVRDRFFSPLKFEDPFGAITDVQYDNCFLYIKETEDAIGNKMVVDIFNYRTLSPNRMIDHNANPSSVLTDELGLVKALAIEGNGDFDGTNYTLANADKADELSGLKEYTDEAEITLINEFFGTATSESTDTATLRTKGNDLLKHASVRFVYDFDTFHNTGNQPVVVASITREDHYAENNNSKIQFNFEYSDGLGKVAMSKVQAEPGTACYIDAVGIKQEKDTTPELRWVGNGRTVLNNKGNPVKQYEPYFSTNFLYESESSLVECGVTPVMYYDALGRLVKTTFPDGTLTRVEFDSWKQLNFDQNDTVKEDECLWFLQRTDNTRSDFINDSKEQRATSLAQSHANTPSSLYLDSLGRSVLSIANNGKDASDKDKLYTTFKQLDIEGNARAVMDARGNSVMAYKYDMLGHRVYQNSMDAGERWILNNLMGKPIHRWDSRHHVYSFEYDDIQRPESSKVKGGDDVVMDNIFEFIIYGEGQAGEYLNNLRGQVFQKYDTAGLIKNSKFDFKGNLIETSRELNANYKEVPNWIPANLNNADLFDTDDLTEFITKFEFDALNREINTTTSDESETKSGFNEAGLLETMSVEMLPVNGSIVKQMKVFVKNINYDAKGQREKIVYGDKDNNDLATTTYTYDKETFRLIHLCTESNGKVVQDLYYTYDPVGNITEIEDKAIPTKFFNNFKIEPKGFYKYDAHYRLIEATGKEHAGQAIDFGQCDNWRDKEFLKSYNPVPGPNDDMAWRSYTQKYSYDPVGNILIMDHKANGGTGNWTRICTYETDNNRLKNTKVGGQTYTYPHHPTHGFINSMPHLSLMQWNFKDELQATARQAFCKTDDSEDNPPETTYYVYDSNGQRVRKVTEINGGGSKKEESVYLGEIEVYKKHTGNNRGLERATLQIMDDTKRIVMVDTQNGVDTDTDLRTVRFQFGNHLGSASLELDDSGNVISYEEYHPFGTTAYQANNATIKSAAKRYRYTGMERDEETGLEYHSVRYYLPWLVRWMSADPFELKGGFNLYEYVNSNPIKLSDIHGTMPFGGSKEEIQAIDRSIPPSVKERVGKAVKAGASATGSFVWNLLTQNFLYQSIAQVQDIAVSGFGAATGIDTSKAMVSNIGRDAASNSNSADYAKNSAIQITRNVLEVPLFFPMGISGGAITPKTSLQEGTETLYHGTPRVIEGQVSVLKPRMADFGQGFSLTDDIGNAALYGGKEGGKGFFLKIETSLKRLAKDDYLDFRPGGKDRELYKEITKYIDSFREAHFPGAQRLSSEIQGGLVENFLKEKGLNPKLIISELGKTRYDSGIGVGIQYLIRSQDFLNEILKSSSWHPF